MLERKIRRYKLMDAHRKLVREGKLLEARVVLQLLRKGRISLGLGDEAWNVERLCEELGCRITCKRSGYIVEVRI